VSDRFYADDDLQAGSVELTGPEAHHLTHVLRKRIGDAVAIFNGRGREATGEIVATNRRVTVVRLTGVRELPPPPGPHVTLAVAVPKQDRFRWLAEKAMELGVRRLIPLRTERGIVEPGGGKLDKIRRAVVEAGKQCGASWLMDVAEVTTFREFIGQAGKPDPRVVIAHPGGGSLAAAVGTVTPSDSVCFVVGPEGGFTDDEFESATAAGAIPVSLGSHKLRIETAAIALAAWARLQSQ
jgi:16S rRNA (uracil1498-N3)-methyltransferase